MPAETPATLVRLAEDAAERLVRYVRIDTRSDEESETYPSTEGQLVLLRLLRDELELEAARVDAPRRERPDHERIVGVGAVSHLDRHARHVTLRP